MVEKKNGFSYVHREAQRGYWDDGTILFTSLKGGYKSSSSTYKCVYILNNFILTIFVTIQ